MNFMIMLVLVSVVSFLVMRRVQRPVEREGVSIASLDPVHVAWMVAGPRRSIETLLVELQSKNAVFITDVYGPLSQWIHQEPAGDVAGLSRHARKAYDLISSPAIVGATPTRVSLSKVMQRWSGILLDVRQELEKLGFQAREEDLTTPRRIRFAFVLILAAAVCAFLALGHPIWQGFIIAAIGVLLVCRPIGISLTTGGLAYRNKLLRERGHLRLAPRQDEVAMAVALGGLVVLAGTPWNAYSSPLVKQRNARSTSGGCGGGGCTTASIMLASCGSSSASDGDGASPASGFSGGGGFSTGGAFGGGGHSTGGCGSNAASDSGGSSGCGGGGCGGGD